MFEFGALLATQSSGMITSRHPLPERSETTGSIGARDKTGRRLDRGQTSATGLAGKANDPGPSRELSLQEPCAYEKVSRIRNLENWRLCAERAVWNVN
jgi:hypothetical protein